MADRLALRAAVVLCGCADAPRMLWKNERRAAAWMRRSVPTVAGARNPAAPPVAA